MLRWLTLFKIFLLVIFCILFSVYMYIWEPQCFFESFHRTEGLGLLQQARIYNPLPERNISKSKNLIVILLPSLTSKILPKLQQIDQNFRDEFVTPLLIMHSEYLLYSQLHHVAKMIQRPLLFLNVNDAFHLFPLDFNPCREKTAFRVRGKWNYSLMIRFWFKLIFELPQLQEYEYLMRLDDDSGLKNHWFNVFNEMRQKNAVYFANSMDVDLEQRLPGTMIVQKVTTDYIERNKITIKQPETFRGAFRNDAVYTYFNNFEVVKLEFFRSPAVRRWVNAIDKTNGIFKYRWGDAILRYIGLAIFAEKQQVLHRSNYNLSYCHKC